MGESHQAALPVALYGVVLLMAAISYWVLQQAIIYGQGADSILARAVGRDLKGKASTVMYLIAVGAAFYVQWLSQAIYILVAVIWLVPDKRIERALVN
jgi:uncharacterized membrane protein